jgi:hypothetical protein
VNSSPPISVHDGRVLHTLAITTAALAALREHIPSRQLPMARSLYLAILELINERGYDVSRKEVAQRAGCSPDSLDKLKPLLCESGVLIVVPRTHGGRHLEHEWHLIEPGQENRATEPKVESNVQWPPPTATLAATSGKHAGARALTPERDTAVVLTEQRNGSDHHQPLEQKSKSTTQKTRVNEGEYEALELALEVEEATPCWDLPVTDENWAPTYLGIDPDRVTIAAKYGIVWTPADHVRMVIDFWRDLLWHFDAAYTEEKLSVVKVALRAYPLEDSTMIIRAIIGGSKSAFHRGKNDRNKTYETLWHFLRIGKDGDKVDSFGRDIGELEVSEYIGIAEDNRKLFACWKAEMFEEVDDNWRFKNRVQLKKDSIGRYRRYEQWKGLARAS